MADRSFADRLGRESETWVTEGIVSAEQAAAIRDRYAVSGEEPRGRATVALAVIGAVTVGVGVIGFVAANWDGMSNGVRLALLTATVAGAYAAAYHLRERMGAAPRVGEALYLVGVLGFGSSLFLVGQMYNVQAHDPLALLLWAGGAVATALVVRSRAVAVASVLIFTAWIGFEFGVALDGGGGDTFAAFPVVALLYGSALYGLSTAAQERLRERASDGLAFPETGRGVGLALGAGGLFVFTFSEATDELVSAGEEIRGSCSAGSCSSPCSRWRAPPRSRSAAGRAGATRRPCWRWRSRPPCSQRWAATMTSGRSCSTSCSQRSRWARSTPATCARSPGS